MRHTRGVIARAAASVGVCLMLLTSCEGSIEPKQPSAESTVASRQSPILPLQQQPVGSPRTLHDEFEELASDIPGFAGMYYDAEGNPIVKVAGRSHGAAEEARARAFARVHPWRARGEEPKGPRFASATYDFPRLRGWHDAAFRNVARLQGFSYITIDVVTNKVTVAVSSEGARSRMLTALAALGIPVDAVSVPIVQPFQFQSDVHLDDYVDQLAGGLQITASRNCTLGFGTQRVRYTMSQPGFVYDARHQFVTTDHCFATQSSMSDPVSQGGSMYNIPWQIGALDRRPQWNSTLNGSCPGVGCSFADAAIVRFNGAREDFLGYIWQTTGANNGSTVISAIAQPFEIGDSLFYESSLVGSQISKLGMRSGWTTATVTQGCLSMPAYWPGYYLLCQFGYSGGNSLEGDSGAPIFQQLVNGKVRLAGIHVGASCNGCANGVASVYNSIRWELTQADYSQQCGNLPRCWTGLNVSGGWRSFGGPEGGGGDGGGGDDGDCPDPDNCFETRKSLNTRGLMSPSLEATGKTRTLQRPKRVGRP